MGWGDIESTSTVRKILATNAVNAARNTAPVSDSRTSVPSERRVWVQPPLPVVDLPEAPVASAPPKPLATVAVTRILISPLPQGDWKVIVKARHSDKGHVYRYGTVSALAEAYELITHFLSSEYWTPDKYPF